MRWPETRALGGAVARRQAGAPPCLVSGSPAGPPSLTRHGRACNSGGWAAAGAADGASLAPGFFKALEGLDLMLFNAVR